MKKLLLLSAVFLLLGALSETFAQNRHRSGRFNDRADRQRIQRGIRSGRITRDEARQLRERERQLRAERRGYRSDGTVSRDERRDIRRSEREQDRQIRDYRHNDNRRDDRDDRYDRDNRNDQRRGDGYYRRGAGSPDHPVFGNGGNRGRGRGRNHD